MLVRVVGDMRQARKCVWTSLRRTAGIIGYFRLTGCPSELGDCFESLRDYTEASLIADGQLPEPDGTTKVSVLTNFSYTVTLTTNLNLNVIFEPLPPTITERPQSMKVLAGSNVTLSVTVTGGAPFEYRWYQDGYILLPWATNSSIVLSNVDQTHKYGVNVRNQRAEVSTDSVEVRVLHPPARRIPPQRSQRPRR